MSFSKKFFALVILICIDIMIIMQIKVSPIEWNSFLPKTVTSSTLKSSLTDKHKQYIFCNLKSKEELKKFRESGLIDTYISLRGKKGTYIFVFDANKTSALLKMTEGVPKSGTLLLGRLLVDNFYEELYGYSIKLLPVTVILLLLFIPLRLWIDILLEMAIYTFFLSLTLNLGIFELNAASLLSLLFLVIYSLTLINYLYSENMSMKRLFFGIQISIVATMLSAVFLIFSKFALIHSFGVVLLSGLVILHLYMNVRIYFTKFRVHRSHTYNFDITKLSPFIARNKLVFALYFIVFLSVGVAEYKNFSIDLNILNRVPETSKEYRDIKAFERAYAPSLPFVIEVKVKNASFEDPVVFKELTHLQKELKSILPGEILQSYVDAFEDFRSAAADKNTPYLLEQFLLANSLINKDVELFSSDMSTTLILAAVSLNITSNEIIKMTEDIKRLDSRYKNFSFHIKGKVADFESYLTLFIQESIFGVAFTLLLTSLFFLFFCKNYFSASLVIFSILFSIITLIGFHTIFHIPLSILSLISMILYVGLVADSFIQLFICYTSEENSCEKSVLNPIFVSNISILFFLFGMMFFKGILGAFAFDMFILLSANLFFILVIVPYLHKKYLRACNG